MSVSRKTKAVLAGAAVAALVAPLTLSASVASADPPPQLVIAKTLSSGKYVGPLQIARNNGHTYVADNFTSHLWEIGNPKPLATGPDPAKGGDIAGVAVNTDNGDVAYTFTDFAHHHAQLVVLRKGKAILNAPIYKYELTNNPDADVTYGAADPSDKCFADTLKANHIPVSYKGEIDSHPYAAAYLGGGSYAVADAGGNDILKVSSTGVVSRIKLIGRQPFVINQAFATANHLDACAVGQTYYTESVPTDVEVGPNGQLYVSVLPGGPEDPTVPPRGRVYEINPTTHAIALLGGGFVNATNLAVSHIGTVYVAQPFAGLVSVLSKGKPVVRMHLPGVAALDFGRDQHLYAATAPALIDSKDPSRVVELEYGTPTK